jgi:hypothetical protein
LEEWGWIDKSQKGIVKDLIISGNQSLQAALEKFDKGDTKELEGKKHSRDAIMLTHGSSLQL